MATYIERSGVDREIFSDLSELAKKNNPINPEFYEKYDVKRGLRNNNGTGVLVGLTKIGEVKGYELRDDQKIPCKGELFYRGIELQTFVKGFQEEKRYGFEECIYLLLFGNLPSKSELLQFNDVLDSFRELPKNFKEKLIFAHPSKDVMNQIQRSLLGLYTYDNIPEDLSISNLVSQSLNLIAKLPTLVAYSYQAKIHNYDAKSMYIHSSQSGKGTAENILYMIRPNSEYTKLEAEILDLLLVVHAEHGGGNNSAFTTRVLASSGTDIYSIIAAAIGSLKGPKHGGANLKVYEMIENIKDNIGAYPSNEELKEYLRKMLKKEVFDNSGLIYGMGHAIYTESDPRAVLLKEKARELSVQKGTEKDFALYENIEKLTKEIFKEQKGEEAIIAANVDLYSGFVYRMLDIPTEIFTPLFAIARMGGWCAHRIEQILSDVKIIRPAYRSVAEKVEYIPLEKR
ncbi:MAG: citrate/2-methylcitrate synthase [Fusobacteriaceae bacterium]|jgi:citrate synthase|nr:citrate/2-methylcitrate synthase [Fusobacteriaceae bacterium]MBP9597298.1 citrate/2-methylcitrate synthase [Fusobacteriaceae bacterium]MBU9919392.1 citrate/2-methylcitrate synthase [Fusobacteriaceae bacterium]